MSLFDFQKPEVTTVVRWCLRVVLVIVLAWLLRRKPEEEEEEEEPQSDPRQNGYRNQRNLNNSGRQNARYPQQQYQNQQRRDQHPNGNIRQRRPDGNSIDFDSVIDKMSKPKEMWEVHKSDSGASKICKRPSMSGEAEGRIPSISGKEGSVSAEGPNSLASSLSSLASSMEKPSGRKPLLLAAKKESKEARQKEAAQTLHGHERPVTCISWNKECNLLFTCGKDNIVCVWSFPEGEQLGTYRGHSGAVWASSVTENSQWLVTSGADRLAIVWEARTSTELARVELPGVVRFVEWASGNSSGQVGEGAERFVTCQNRFGSKPAALAVWRFDGEAIEEQLQITTLPTPANQVRWAGKQLLASAHENGVLVFWKSDTGEEVRRLEAHTLAISKFDFSSDREVVATASADQHVKVWDIASSTDMKLIYEKKTDRPLNCVALGPLTRSTAVGPPGDRPRSCAVIAAGGQDARDVAKTSSDSEQFGTLMFKLDGAEELPGELQLDGVTKGHFGPVHTLAFAQDGSAIASGSEDGCVRFHIFEANGKADAGAEPVAA